MPSDAPGTHAWLVLMKAYRALVKHADQSFETLDIGLTDFVILEMLLHKGPQKVDDIGRRIGLTSGAITSAVDRSDTQGLVARSFDAADRRARRYSGAVEGGVERLTVYRPRGPYGTHGGRSRTTTHSRRGGTS